MYNLKNLPASKLSRSIEGKIQELVLFNLGLDSLNKLRDKFEGVAFYNRVRAQLFSIVAIENYFNLKIVEWERLKAEKIDNLQQINLGNKTAYVISALINEPFLIPKNIQADYLIFVYISSDYAYLAGYLGTKPSTLYKTLINKNISPIKLRTYQGSIDNRMGLNNIEALKNYTEKSI